MDPRHGVGRLLLATAVGALCGAFVPGKLGWQVRATLGWNMGATVLLLVAWSRIWRADAEATRRHAAPFDPGRTFVWAIVTVSSVFSLFAAAGLLRQTRSEAELLAVLCLWAVGSAWSVTHTSFALRYAHLYYRDEGQGEGGLEFPGNQAPHMLDFAYFAFTVGMCFQVSDVTVSSQRIRSAVLMHAVLSFAYNTVILALALNLAFGRLG
jgi:uncharacterized membrane protein